ncbi:MAG: hypothetical protein AB7G76_03380 [Steroidobacteraceae bacterium]
MSYRVVGTLLALMCLGACNRVPDAAPTPATSTAPRKAPLSPDMVSAVSGSKSAAAVDLKFALTSRPEPGRALDIDLAVIPLDRSATIRVIVQNTDGLTITAGQEMRVPPGAEAGVPLIHRVTIVPARDGIFSLSAVALVDTDKSSVTRTFAIPIIVGEGVTPAELKPETPAAKTD